MGWGAPMPHGLNEKNSAAGNRNAFPDIGGTVSLHSCPHHDEHRVAAQLSAPRRVRMGLRRKSKSSELLRVGKVASRSYAVKFLKPLRGGKVASFA